MSWQPQGATPQPLKMGRNLQKAEGAWPLADDVAAVCAFDLGSADMGGGDVTNVDDGKVQVGHAVTQPTREKLVQKIKASGFGGCGEGGSKDEGDAQDDQMPTLLLLGFVHVTGRLLSQDFGVVIWVMLDGAGVVEMVFSQCPVWVVVQNVLPITGYGPDGRCQDDPDDSGRVLNGAEDVPRSLQRRREHFLFTVLDFLGHLEG